ncbi:extracellular solute-binding protein [Cohnella silvisoli]|uniref:Extracellular solute-binding protein n=1 Tax=Cohnella silvisoli TaxID=2873699 RepID=A0ABV1KU42_9BACL|nr:extracellular solute-binding protein [Cohnella silvisoli]MCD9023238.1 extracellular solute-binding protein [Cohnella silvisoli]
MAKRNWRLAALSGAIVLMLAATACGKGDTQGSSASKESASAAPSATATSSQETKQEDGPLTKYDPPIEVSTIYWDSAPFKFKDGESLDNNVWTQEYENTLGIKLKTAWSFFGSLDQYIQKMNVAIGGGDLPDFMQVLPAQYKQMAAAGQLEDLTPYYEKYASDLTKDILNQDGGVQLKASYVGGKLLGIPHIGSTIDGTPLLWVRSDWLKKLNLPEPKTIDDLITIADAFVNKDPDGNSKADTYGLGVSNELYGGGPGLEGFFNAFHAYPGGMWIKDSSGKLAYGAVQPEMKTALGKLQEMYKKGLIDQEFGTKDSGKIQEQLVSGKLGMFFGQMWTPLWFGDGKKNDPKMDFQAYALPTTDGQPVFKQSGFPTGMYWVVKKGAAHPEAVFKLMNVSEEKGYGKTADATKYMTDNGIEFFKYAPILVEPPRKNLNNHLLVTEALNSKDTSKLNSEQKSIYDTIVKYQGGDSSGWGYDRVFGPTGAFSVIDQYVKNNEVLVTEYTAAPTESMGKYQSTLDKMEKETVTKIIMGAASLDAFDQFVANWKKAGGDTITKEVDDWAATK